MKRTQDGMPVALKMLDKHKLKELNSLNSVRKELAAHCVVNAIKSPFLAQS